MRDAFAHYNRRRIHSAFGYLTPYEYLEAWKAGRVPVEEKVNN